MGRLATSLAAAFADADNLPVASRLPNISFTDALLPRTWASVSSVRRGKAREPVDSNVGRKMHITYYDIKKNKNGSKSVVAHKTPTPSAHGESTKDKKDSKGKNGSKDVNKNGDKDVKKSDMKQNGGGDNAGMREWTAEEDAKLKALKGEGKTWNEIANELDRFKNQVTKRWKEIDGGADDNKKKNDNGNNNKKGRDKDKAGGGCAEDKNLNQQTKKSKKEKKQERKEAQNSPAAATGKAGRQSSNEGETRFTMREWLTLQEDDMFSFGELQLLTELVARDQSQSWLRIASRFYDKTGRRVHPEDIREKFEQMNDMLSK